MVTCRDLLNLELFKTIQLVAGHEGLDRAISWPYPKHTKGITPWVKGGEFVLVSGYELGVDDAELLHLIDEAVTNQLSGLLVEGGVNFRFLSDTVIDKANKEKIPLFFAPRVVSFLDISKEISSLIMELQLADKYTASLLEHLLSVDPTNTKELQYLFEKHHIPSDCRYQIIWLSVTNTSAPESNMSSMNDPAALRIFNKLRAPCDAALKQLGLRIIAMTSFNHTEYLVYGFDDELFSSVWETLNRLRAQFSLTHPDYNVIMGGSEIVQSTPDIATAFNQAGFVISLMTKGILAGNSNTFSDIGSYQFLFYVEDKSFLLRFRDHYLRPLYEAEQGKTPCLIDTLRVYLSFGGNVLSTAKSLYVHRNTLQHRLDRIESITKKRLDDADERQNFRNALMILDIYPF